MADDLAAIEASGRFSNGGPVVSRFETRARDELFTGSGACLAVSNATLGLMVAIREAAGRDWRGERFAMMPSFTFAATAQAALWAGLTPLLVDSDPADWSASAEAEATALERHGDRIAVVVPYATFGNNIDLARYAAYAERYNVGIVVDAAASLGALDDDGRGFGSGQPFATVFSMHATKPFATAEGGLIHCDDAERIDRLRKMINFGFGAPRIATGPGLNAKLPEILGLMACGTLDRIDDIARHRTELAAEYATRLAGFDLQRPAGKRPMAQFQSLLLPREFAPHREKVLAELAASSIGAAHYFAPHLRQQPWFQQHAMAEPTPVADDIAARIVNLPLHEGMTCDDVKTVVDALHDACQATASATRAIALARGGAALPRLGTVIVGGGPAGIAMLAAAANHGKLSDLLENGLGIVERSDRLGVGEIGSYAIASDSTAETFLSAVDKSPWATLAALVDHATGREVAAYSGKLGVPLARTGPFLEMLGARMGDIARSHGARVALNSEVVEARQLRAGGWSLRVRSTADGSEQVWHADNIVVATGGYQCEESIREATIGGATMAELAGDRLMTGDAMLRIGGIDTLRQRLDGIAAPRIAVVGASTSALAAINLMLTANPPLPLGAGAISLLHRQPLRPFYASAEAAHADGYRDFGPDDICPVSGFVHRLAGFRLESRELVLRMLQVGGRPAEPRVALHDLNDGAGKAQDILREADIVIAALGYRARALPLRSSIGDRIALNADAPGRPRMVDQQCRIVAADGRVLANAFGIGLAAGFVPSGALGGEPNFTGKANGLWLWQNDVGLLIVDQLLTQRQRAAA